jgi:uracil-DNA glycosylase
MPLRRLLQDVRGCNRCAGNLPLGPRPVLQMSSTARLLIVGQAPGRKVHDTGIPWNDASGDVLRNWLNLDLRDFYDASKIAILPIGLCYPGARRGGDAPPRPECAPLWHDRLTSALPNLQITLLVGAYAQEYYLGRRPGSPSQKPCVQPRVMVSGTFLCRIPAGEVGCG